MSTHYRPLSKIIASQLFDGHLDMFNIHELIPANDEGSRVPRRCLTDGRNFLWVSTDDFGFISSFTRYAGSRASEMVRHISYVFSTRIVSEYEPEFWGCKTDEELEAALNRSDEEQDREILVELLKYVRGEENNLSPWLVEEGEIAKKLVRANPTLLKAEEELWKATKIIVAKRLEARNSRSDLDGKVPF